MLQIFTYSTGLALTGRSAACVPETATSPAAEPRRRLFTIFIRTSKFTFHGRVPSPPGAFRPMDERSPSVPRRSDPGKTPPDRDPNFGDWGCPSVAFNTLRDDRRQTISNEQSNNWINTIFMACCQNTTNIFFAEYLALIRTYASTRPRLQEKFTRFQSVKFCVSCLFRVTFDELVNT